MKPLPPYESIIFDLDGTLIDSMPVWKTLIFRWLDFMHLQPIDGLRDAIEVMNLEDASEYLIEQYRLNLQPCDVFEQWQQIMQDEYLHRVPLKNGVLAFIRKQQKLGIKMGIATSTFPKACHALLKHYRISDCFAAIAFTEEAPRNKTWPDVYLIAAERMGVTPEHCLVFEDCGPALQGVQAAGMKCVAVYDEYYQSDWDRFSRAADLFIHSFEELL